MAPKNVEDKDEEAVDEDEDEVEADEDESGW